MVTIVIKDNNVSKEDILAYIQKENIKGEYEVITQEEYQKRKAAEPIFEFSLPPSYRMIDLEGEMLERERKQRNFQKQQNKWAMRYSNKYRKK